MQVSFNANSAPIDGDVIFESCVNMISVAIVLQRDPCFHLPHKKLKQRFDVRCYKFCPWIVSINRIIWSTHQVCKWWMDLCFLSAVGLCFCIGKHGVFNLWFMNSVLAKPEIYRARKVEGSRGRVILKTTQNCSANCRVLSRGLTIVTCKKLYFFCIKL